MTDDLTACSVKAMQGQESAPEGSLPTYDGASNIVTFP